MNESGWIKVHRSIRDNAIWASSEPFDKRSAWIDLLMSANYTDGEMLSGGQVVNVQRGSFVTSESALMSRWKWSKNKIRTFLKLLQSENMIEINACKKWTRINIVNYSVFQDSQTAKEPPRDHQRTTKEPQKDHRETTKEPPKVHDIRNKEYKEEKESKNGRIEEKKYIYYPTDDKLDQTFADFVEMRKKIKKPMTDKAISLAMKKLETLAADENGIVDNDIAILIIEQSIERDWHTFYPLQRDTRPCKKRDIFQEIADAKEVKQNDI